MMPEVQTNGVPTGAEKPATRHDDSSAEADEIQGPTKPIPPPDVGLQAYLQILGGFFLMFNTWGIVLTFGTFQSFVSPLSSSKHIHLIDQLHSMKRPQQPPSKPRPPPPPGSAASQPSCSSSTADSAAGSSTPAISAACYS